MATHSDEDVFPTKWEQNVRPTAHGLEMKCPQCEGWHMVQELMATGCPQTGWLPDVIELNR